MNLRFYKSEILKIPTTHIPSIYRHDISPDIHNMSMIQIFGKDDESRCTCINVLEYFPHFYVELPFEITRLDLIIKLKKELTELIGRRRGLHIYKVLIVTRRNFYGYHVKTIPFLKILLYNHEDIKKFANIFKSDNKLRTKLKCYEVHIPFSLQFLSDCSLFFMNPIKVFKISKATHHFSTSKFEYSCSFFDISRKLPPTNIKKILNELSLPYYNILSEQRINALDNVNRTKIENSNETMSESMVSQLYVAKYRMNNCEYSSYLNFSLTFPKVPHVEAGQREVPYHSSIILTRHLILLSVEVFFSNRKLHPNPKNDKLLIIAYSFYKDGKILEFGFISSLYLHELKILDYVKSETDIFERFIMLIERYDPDILLGYDVQNSSWGLIEYRFRNLFNESFIQKIFRSKNLTEITPTTNWDKRKGIPLRIHGRIILNVWRIVRKEMNVKNYSIENVAYVLFKINLPLFSQKSLNRLSDVAGGRNRVFTHLLLRVKLNIDIIEKTNTLLKYCESASLFGIDLFSVIYRGSQYKVESILNREVHEENFLLISNVNIDHSKQKSTEYSPLVFEPEGKTYFDPVLIFDFQSLYPSIMIAYNLCYSTFINGTTKDSFKKIKTGDGRFYVDTIVRRGIIPKFLTELLNARLVVKKYLDASVSNSEKNILDSIQLAIKNILNVTYGYSAALFTGRMPFAELADTIVSTGRNIMERSIESIQENKKWNAKVIYGDTDSLFVLLPGRTKQKAFEIGKEIADFITCKNLPPIVLKFEKMYQPCSLLAKKKYFGLKHVNEHNPPKLEVKGVEIVRRDTCDIICNTLEEIILQLYKSKSLEYIEEYISSKIKNLFIKPESLDISQLIINKQLRSLKFSGNTDNQYFLYESKENTTNLAPQTVIAKDKMNSSFGSFTNYGERVPFIVIYSDRRRLADNVVNPIKLFTIPSLDINTQYYISKQLLPASSRIVSAMFPHNNVANLQENFSSTKHYTEGFSVSSKLIKCGYCRKLNIPQRMEIFSKLCDKCENKKDIMMLIFVDLTLLREKFNDLYRGSNEMCWGVDPLDKEFKCWSLSCSVFQTSIKNNKYDLEKYYRLLDIYIEMWNKGE
jgi:DNA polymerase zeta